MALRRETLFAIGGLLEHAPAFTAVCNPTVNSYKRLVAAWDAPIYTGWSHRSANALVRVPSAPGMETKIEMRTDLVSAIRKTVAKMMESCRTTPRLLAG